MFKYLITQKVFILVGKARPSMDGLDPPLAPNSIVGYCSMVAELGSISDLWAS